MSKRKLSSDDSSQELEDDIVGAVKKTFQPEEVFCHPVALESNPILPAAPSSWNEHNGRKAMKLFGMTKYLVCEDYILYPYLIEEGEGLQKPRSTRVSHILDNMTPDFRKIYQDTHNTLQRWAEHIDFSSDDMTFLNHLKVPRNADIDSKMFIKDVKNASYEETGKSSFHTLFLFFLRSVIGNCPNVWCQSELQLFTKDVSFPMIDKYKWFRIRAKPDITILSQQDNDFLPFVLAEVKGYKELEFNPMRSPASSSGSDRSIGPLSHEEGSAGTKYREELESATSGSSTSCGRDSVNKELALYNYMIAELNSDINSHICRKLDKDEKGIIGLFITQLVGAVFAAIDYTHLQTMKWFQQRMKHQKTFFKNMRFGIAVIGFKVFFVNVCLNDRKKLIKCPGVEQAIQDNFSELSSKVVSGKEKVETVIVKNEMERTRTDVFMTRPFDILKASDRKSMADIIFALISKTNEQ